MSDRIDWRLPEYRRESFMRQYLLHLQYGTHPGLVYPLLPALALAAKRAAPGVSEADVRAWVMWLNGNTQNPVTTQLILQAAPSPDKYEEACTFVQEERSRLDWDTDRRHQKFKFEEATRAAWGGGSFMLNFIDASLGGWDELWRWAMNLPHMGRLSCWSMLEYGQILFGKDIVPDATSMLLGDASGSKSHRNGLLTLLGYDAVYWDWSDVKGTGFTVVDLEYVADELLIEAQERSGHNPDATRLTLESALCTWKSWHKPNRRYPNVYADMHHDRVRKAEKVWGNVFGLQWQVRRNVLPLELRKEERWGASAAIGLDKRDQNQYRETGTPAVLGLYYSDMESERWHG